MAPTSSGLGKLTVGKFGSGVAWLVTVVGAGKPAAANTRRTVSSPTPCRAVCTTATSVADPAGSIAATRPT